MKTNSNNKIRLLSAFIFKVYYYSMVHMHARARTHTTHTHTHMRARCINPRTK